MPVARRLKRLLHELDAQIEDLPRRDHAVEAVVGPGECGTASLDCGKPSPVTRGLNQARGVAEIADDMGNCGHPYLAAEVVDEVAHALGRDPVGRRLEKVIRIEFCQKAKVAPPG